MTRDGLDAYLIYTNLVRPSAVSWLTGFTPYWIDSILLVRRDGVPVLATALSKRVADWIRSTSWLDEIINTPKPGTAIGQRLAAADCKRVGVLEFDGFPSGFYDDLVAAAPSAELVDATATFAAGRRSIDAAERTLIEHADALALAALAEVDPTRADNAGALAGLVEKHARLAAAEEAYIAVAPDLAADRRLIRVSGPLPLADRFALRASIAYKGSWVRRTRTFARDAAGSRAVARADAWFDRVARTIASDKPLATQIAARIARLPGAELKGWMAESCVASYPLEVIAGSASPSKETPAAGAFLVLSMELIVDGVPWLGAAPAFVGGSAGT
jgi:Creatinase/Prolidase N-terminal domain